MTGLAPAGSDVQVGGVTSRPTSLDSLFETRLNAAVVSTWPILGEMALMKKRSGRGVSRGGGDWCMTTGGRSDDWRSGDARPRRWSLVMVSRLPATAIDDCETTGISNARPTVDINMPRAPMARSVGHQRQLDAARPGASSTAAGIRTRLLDSWG